jgi:hypothetical protein
MHTVSAATLSLALSISFGTRKLFYALKNNINLRSHCLPVIAKSVALFQRKYAAERNASQGGHHGLSRLWQRHHLIEDLQAF